MMQTYSFVVLTNAVEGREEEYNDWYTDRHLYDVLDIPGIVRARRFRVAGVQRATEPCPFKYLALYEIETDDLAGVLSTLSTRSGTEVMPVSDAMAVDKLAYVFEPITETRFEKDALRVF